MSKKVLLSMIMVNYRSAIFCLQAIDSFKRAAERISYEIILVDNDSQDDSLLLFDKYLSEDVELIVSNENLGFAKANNLAIERSKGKYILLLNPDTIIAEDSITLSLNKMEEDASIGALANKMYDIKGNYLRESKRALPNMWSSFCKFSGLSNIFPKSKIFASYYMGHLSDEKEGEIDILCGAYMMIRREALDESGLFDERFFMYGEDIDLSYRIKKAGYRNYFLPIPMLHYKGESSKQNLERYIDSFYDAMYLFYEKYNSSKGKFIQRFLLRNFIYLVKKALKLKAKFVKNKTKDGNLSVIVLENSLLVNADKYSNIEIISDKFKYKDIIDFVIKNANKEYDIRISTKFISKKSSFS